VGYFGWIISSELATYGVTVTIDFANECSLHLNVRRRFADEDASESFTLFDQSKYQQHQSLT